MSLSVDAIDIKKRIESCKNLQEVEGIRLEYLGKKGLIPSEMKLLGKLSIDGRKLKGQELNKLKSVIENAIDNQKTFIENAEIEKKLQNENIDVTLPQLETSNGKIHPISQTIFSIIEIFGNLNYSVEAGPDIESDFNNFSALNIPPHHPAREMQDTFYIKDQDEENKPYVLRTHTSPVQIRTMLSQEPPIKIIAPGRTYRCDSDSTHSPMFHQVEGLFISKNANMSDLKGTLIEFCKQFFEVQDLKVRFRPSYFPFTEPSAEMDIAYHVKNNTLHIGEGDKWLEILGCGMVNPVVIENCQIDNLIYQGFAFGMGLDRITMLKHGLTDIRSFFNANLNWINQNGFGLGDY